MGTLSKRKSPLVSIIMNCHNGEKFLNKSLKSVLNQTYNNWELIFWDNLSNDRSSLILKSFKDKRIRYFKSKKFSTLYEARNLAIKKAKGDYVSFLDTDDVWLKNKIRVQVNFFQKNKKFNIIYSNYYVLDQIKNEKYIRYKKNLNSGRITQDLLNNYTIGIGTACVKKKIFDKQKFNKKYNIIGDFDFFVKLSKKNEIGYIKKPLFVYRIHTLNYSTKNLNEFKLEFDNWIRINKYKYEKLGFSLKKQKFYLRKIKIKNFLNFFLRACS